MEFIDLAKNRFSCKSFDGRAVEQEKLDIILEAGRVAPTAKNAQEQRIYVVTSKEGLEKVDKCCPCRYNAGTVVVVAYDKDHTFTYPGGRKNSGDEDATIVATHMLLAAASVGVDSCWINYFDPDVLAKELGLPKNEDILMILDLGYGIEGTKPLANHTNRKDISETVFYK